MSETDWWERAAKVYQEDGYLVLGGTFPRKVGEICNTPIYVGGELVDLPQPFRVIAMTTGEEFIRQALLAGYPSPRIPDDAYFYRVITE